MRTVSMNKPAATEVGTPITPMTLALLAMSPTTVVIAAANFGGVEDDVVMGGNPIKLEQLGDALPASRSLVIRDQRLGAVPWMVIESPWQLTGEHLDRGAEKILEAELMFDKNGYAANQYVALSVETGRFSYFGQPGKWFSLNGKNICPVGTEPEIPNRKVEVALNGGVHFARNHQNGTMAMAQFHFDDGGLMVKPVAFGDVDDGEQHAFFLNLTHGDLLVEMRASMAMPGLFIDGDGKGHRCVEGSEMMNFVTAIPEAGSDEIRVTNDKNEVFLINPLDNNPQLKKVLSLDPQYDTCQIISVPHAREVNPASSGLFAVMNGEHGFSLMEIPAAA